MAASCARAATWWRCRWRTTWATSPTARPSRPSTSSAPAERDLAASRDAATPDESSLVAIAARPPQHQPFEHLMLDFLAYLEFERGLSRNTLEAYRSDLLQYGRFLSEHGGDALAASGSDVSDFLTTLARGNGGDKAPASPATLHRKAACLRSFYRHLRREGHLDNDPTAALSSPRRGKKLPEVLTRGEVQSLLSQPAGGDPPSLR